MISANDEYLRKLQSEKEDEYEWKIFSPSHGNYADIVHENLNGCSVSLLADNESPLVFQCLKCNKKFFMDGCSNCNNNQIRFDRDINSQGGPVVLMCTRCGKTHYYWSCPTCGNNNLFSKNEPFVHTMQHLAKKGGCFIATAVYGAQYQFELNTLRNFRDNILLKNLWGRKFVGCYYTVSPPIANFIRNRHILKKIIKLFFLDPIVKIISRNEKRRKAWHT